MPWASGYNAEYTVGMAVGPVLLCSPELATQPTQAPITAAGTWSSGLLPSDGYKVVSVGLQSTQAGQISVQRYIDNMLGQAPQGPALTATITANTPCILNIVDGLPFGCMTVVVSNISGAPATITNFAVLLSA